MIYGFPLVPSLLTFYPLFPDTVKLSTMDADFSMTFPLATTLDSRSFLSYDTNKLISCFEYSYIV